MSDLLSVYSVKKWWQNNLQNIFKPKKKLMQWIYGLVVSIPYPALVIGGAGPLDYYPVLHVCWWL